MGEHSLLPKQRHYDQAYALACKLAGEELAKTRNLEQLCRQSGARYSETDSQKVITLEYLNRTYQVTLPNAEVTLVGSQEEVPIKDKVLILHYLTRARGTSIANRMITFKEIADGALYSPTFAKRTIKPIVDNFGDKPERLVATANKLGGFKVDYGDVAVTINAFPYVPITLVLWRGDEEFTPSGNIMFDATVTDYLPTEDITVLCETITWKLVKSLKQD